MLKLYEVMENTHSGNCIFYDDINIKKISNRIVGSNLKEVFIIHEKINSKPIGNIDFNNLVNQNFKILQDPLMFNKYLKTKDVIKILKNIKYEYDYILVTENKNGVCGIIW